MRTAARSACARRQHVSPSISSPSGVIDCPCSSALEAPRRRDPDGVWVFQSVDFDDFILRSQVQMLAEVDADAGTKHGVAATVVRERRVITVDLDVAPEDARAREYLDGTERQRAYDAR